MAYKPPGRSSGAVFGEPHPGLGLDHRGPNISTGSIYHLGRAAAEGTFDEYLRELMRFRQENASLRGLVIAPRQQPHVVYVDDDGLARVDLSGDVVGELQRSREIDDSTFRSRLDGVPVFSDVKARTKRGVHQLVVTVGDALSLFYEEGYTVQGEKMAANRILGTTTCIPRAERSTLRMPLHRLRVAEVTGGFSKVEQLCGLAKTALPQLISLEPVGYVTKEAVQQ